MATIVKRTLLQRRDDDDDIFYDYDNDDDGVYWWYSDTGVIVKWTVFIVIVVLFLSWLIGGYLHAKSRLRKGLQPMGYHRVLVTRRMRAQFDPNYPYNQPAYMVYPAQPPNGYQMYNMPPPVYDPSRPPMYEPPAGGTKVDPMQDRRDHHDQNDYQPPPGPPPASTSR